MWCSLCQKSTAGKDCDCTVHPNTACAVCGWCPSCVTDDATRVAESMAGLWEVPEEVSEILALAKQILANTEKIMTELSQQQQDINAAATAITTLLTDLGNQTTQILADVAALQQQLAAGTPVTTTQLDAAVAGIQAVDTALDNAVTSVSGLVTPAPAAPVSPASPTTPV